MKTVKNLSDREYDEFIQWLSLGVSNGWISEPCCVTHNGLALTEEEESEWEDGYDPCTVGVRIWIDG